MPMRAPNGGLLVIYKAQGPTIRSWCASTEITSIVGRLMALGTAEGLAFLSPYTSYIAEAPAGIASMPLERYFSQRRSVKASTRSQWGKHVDYYLKPTSPSFG